MKPNLILASHGNLALELLKSVNMIVGDISDVKTVCMTAEDGMEGTTQKMQAALDACGEQPVVIVCDLYGGTPFNVATILSQKKDRTRIVSGLNLGMIVEYSVSEIEDENELAEYLCQVGKNGVVAPVAGEDDDDCDIE